MHLSIPILFLIIAGISGAVAISEKLPHKKKMIFAILSVSLTLLAIAVILDSFV